MCGRSLLSSKRVISFSRFFIVMVSPQAMPHHKKEKPKKLKDKEHYETVIHEDENENIPDDGDMDYGLAVDAGSGGSRMHIFRWPTRRAFGAIGPFSIPQTQTTWMKAVTPGLSFYVDHPENAVNSFIELIEFAKKKLAHRKQFWHLIPLYVKATAGMRVIKNLPIRDRIMNTMRDFLLDKSNSPFMFSVDNCRVISGEEEGVYGWMSVNTLTQTLLHTAQSSSYGALDLGGASTQITFRPMHDVLSNYFPLRIKDQKLRMYSHSFLYMGHSESLLRIHKHLKDEALAVTLAAFRKIAEKTTDTKKLLKEHQNGLEEPKERRPVVDAYTLQEDIHKAEKRLQKQWIQSPCFPDGYFYNQTFANPSGKGSPSLFFFQGVSDLKLCRDLILSMFRKDAECWSNTCSFAGIYQPRVENTAFVAFSGFKKTVVDKLGLPWDVSLKTIGQVASHVCSMDLTTVTKIFTWAHETDIPTLCFDAMYLWTLLVQGYGLSELGTRILWVAEVNGTEIDWVQGSMLYEVNAMPWEIDGCRDKKPLLIKTTLESERELSAVRPQSGPIIWPRWIDRLQAFKSIDIGKEPHKSIKEPPLPKGVHREQVQQVDAVEVQNDDLDAHAAAAARVNRQSLTWETMHAVVAGPAKMLNVEQLLLQMNEERKGREGREGEQVRVRKPPCESFSSENNNNDEDGSVSFQLGGGNHGSSAGGGGGGGEQVNLALLVMWLVTMLIALFFYRRLKRVEGLLMTRVLPVVTAAAESGLLATSGGGAGGAGVRGYGSFVEGTQPDDYAPLLER